MTKLYSMIEHSFAAYSNLKVEISSVNGDTVITKEFKGFQNVLDFLKGVKTSLTLDEMFRVFVDNRAIKHVVLQLGHNGEIETCIKITLENK